MDMLFAISGGRRPCSRYVHGCSCRVSRRCYRLWRPGRRCSCVLRRGASSSYSCGGTSRARCCQVRRCVAAEIAPETPTARHSTCERHDHGDSANAPISRRSRPRHSTGDGGPASNNHRTIPHPDQIRSRKVRRERLRWDRLPIAGILKGIAPVPFTAGVHIIDIGSGVEENVVWRVLYIHE